MNNHDFINSIFSHFQQNNNAEKQENKDLEENNQNHDKCHCLDENDCLTLKKNDEYDNSICNS